MGKQTADLSFYYSFCYLFFTSHFKNLSGTTNKVQREHSKIELKYYKPETVPPDITWNVLSKVYALFRDVSIMMCVCRTDFLLRFDNLTTRFCLSKPSCRNIKKQKNSTVFTFALPLCSCLERCVPLLFVYFGKEALLSTCLLWVNQYRPDSCQLCPSTGSACMAAAGRPPHSAPFSPIALRATL